MAGVETSSLSAPPATRAKRRVRATIVWAVLISLMFPVAIVGYYTLFITAGVTSVDPATQQLAAEDAGGAVQAFTGPHHTVYHSMAALPSADAPQADGKPTLVWFSETGCKQCGAMESFAYQTAHRYLDQLVFVEKAVDRDASAARYGVAQPPMFVLLDERGAEVTRFGAEPNAASFDAAIRRALLKVSP
jgi:hypothetical protein